MDTQDVTYTVMNQIERTAKWRKDLAFRFKNDARNAKAAKALELLAGCDAHTISAARWASIADDCDHLALRDACSQAGRDVSFRRHVQNLDQFLTMVVENLSATRH